MIRLLLADDHALFREALRAALEREPDMAVVGEAEDGEQAVAQARALSPDVVLMDIVMPGLNGIEATRLLTRPGATGEQALKVLALSSHRGRLIVDQALDAGALGYVNKAAGRDQLLRAIRAVAAGERYLCAECTVPAFPAQQGDAAALGQRETDMLNLLAQGLNGAQIAARLHIAEGMVEVRRRTIMRKLGLHSVTELTQYAARQGMGRR